MIEFYLKRLLRKTDNAVLLTRNGNMQCGYAHQQEDIIKNADALQALMIEVMKKKKSKKGRWLWCISEQWSSVNGYNLDDDK